MSGRTRNLLLAGGLVIAAGFVAVNLLSLEPAAPTRSFTTPAPGGRMASPEPGSGDADLSAGGGQATHGSVSEQVARGGRVVLWRRPPMYGATRFPLRSSRVCRETLHRERSSSCG